MPKKTALEIIEIHFVKWLIGAAGVSILTAVVFYFNTNHVMAMHTGDIKELKAVTQKLKQSIESIKIVPTLNKQEIAFIKKEISQLSNSQKDIEQKQDEMLELLYKIDNK